jgi:hypothetical protein
LIQFIGFQHVVRQRLGRATGEQIALKVLPQVMHAPTPDIQLARQARGRFAFGDAA